LFLDVVVPEKILKSAGSGYGAPVLVWIYGGGYTLGEKTNNPAGLFAASGNVSEGEVIYVALNYRLGALVRMIPVQSECFAAKLLQDITTGCLTLTSHTS
jgi:hypothetical protein